LAVSPGQAEIKIEVAVVNRFQLNTHPIQFVSRFTLSKSCHALDQNGVSFQLKPCLSLFYSVSGKKILLN
jgi:hypothetical protein